jgi:hypothetical protein
MRLILDVFLLSLAVVLLKPIRLLATDKLATDKLATDKPISIVENVIFSTISNIFTPLRILNAQSNRSMPLITAGKVDSDDRGSPK